MLVWWLVVIPPLLLTHASKRPSLRGVPPDRLSLYKGFKPSDAWSCADGSARITFSAVNDDYCDCMDGSDEPGTSACTNGTFYCNNAGHIGSHVRSSRVDDGLCEPECCDGSDESSGACTNVCKMVGEEYRREQEQLRKTRKTGAKIRSSYIAFAKKEKTRLEALVTSQRTELDAAEKELQRLKGILEQTETTSRVEMEVKKQSPLYQQIIIHSKALKSLQLEHKKQIEKQQQLGDILDALRLNYNPNYQDMAVLEAVRGWEAVAELPHINDVRMDENAEQVSGNQEPEAEGELEEGMWTPDQLEHQLDGLLSQDYESLLLQHDSHLATKVYDLTEYIPDSILPHFEYAREMLIEWLEILGLVKSSDEGSVASSRARQAVNDAEDSFRNIKDALAENESSLEKLFKPEGFGLQGEWKKLDKLCLEKDTGEYTYEVCLFDEAKQKPNKGGMTQNLGRFSSWNPDSSLKPGEPSFYSKQVYSGGGRCWNGPERSVKLELVCGTENALHTVTEPEKCEYLITGTSPALCYPLEDAPNREEL